MTMTNYDDNTHRFNAAAWGKPLELTYLDNTPVLVDPAGGVWWPNEEAAETIYSADDACRLDVATSCEFEGLGEWRD